MSQGVSEHIFFQDLIANKFMLSTTVCFNRVSSSVWRTHENYGQIFKPFFSFFKIQSTCTCIYKMWAGFFNQLSYILSMQGCQLSRLIQESPDLPVSIFTSRGIEWSIRDFARLRDPCLTLRDRDPNVNIKTKPETLPVINPSPRLKNPLSRSKC